MNDVAAVETRITRLAFFGRLADDLTRQVLRPENMSVSIDGVTRRALLKDDGHFAFADVEPSLTAYRLRLGGAAYQTRTVTQALPTLGPVEVTLPGEDELYVVLTGAPTPASRVSFAMRSFVRPIVTGAAVIGSDGFTATLAEPVDLVSTV